MDVPNLRSYSRGIRAKNWPPEQCVSDAVIDTSFEVTPLAFLKLVTMDFG